MLKNKLFLLLIFIITIYSINYVNANSFELLGKIIYIDPGHGGMDPGAIYKNIKESEINLEIALKLKNKLESEGAIVYLTRNIDIDLSKIKTLNHKRSDLNNRIKAINNSNCDLFISLHLNSDNSSIWHGAQVFYDDKNINNKKFAEIMQKYIKKNLNSNRKYKKVNNLYLLKNINKTGLLFEMGFISNPNERYLLQQEKYQSKIVDTIYYSMKEYLNN